MSKTVHYGLPYRRANFEYFDYDSRPPKKKSEKVGKVQGGGGVSSENQKVHNSKCELL